MLFLKKSLNIENVSVRMTLKKWNILNPKEDIG